MRKIDIVKCVVLGLLAVTVFGLITMALWNWLVPTLFNGPVITYWQALGLLILSKILFGGWGGGKHHHQSHGPAPYWKHRFYEKFSNMPAEQREEFKRRMKEKWCRFEQRGSEQNSDTSRD
ncbi:MAG TPA: hypothetical protein VIN08_06230 [Ohtaekwangia sp.]|uniref:hypothetical protein n=1 Tax=Ohtaekwangia sp. TaxID=2066019 RepID=UPI002F952EFB